MVRLPTPWCETMVDLGLGGKLKLPNAPRYAAVYFVTMESTRLFPRLCKEYLTRGM
jgi:hypothetical protein